MRLLQVTALFFLLSNSLCLDEDRKDVQNISTPPPANISTTNASAMTPGSVSLTNLDKSTDGTPLEGTTNNETSKTPLVPARNLQTPTLRVETTTNDLQKNEVFTIKTTVPNLPTSIAVSALPSSQDKTENQTSIRTTEMSVISQRPDASRKTTETTAASLTSAKTTSQRPDTEDGKIAATPSTTPSYSSE